jgi:two-component system chemotaxis response regulator CheB
MTPQDPADRASEIAERDMAEQASDARRGKLSTFTCPECGGSLWQTEEPGLTHFRCHVGHAYNGEALLAEQTEALEAALWTAVRTFREKGVLSRQLAAHSRGEGDVAAAARFDEQAKQADEYGRLIIQHVLHGDPTGHVPGHGPPVRDGQP